MSEPGYNQGFFDRQREVSAASARVVVPALLRLLPVRSVIDVGCGIGAWLTAFRENGVSDFLGVDGDYVKPESLLIPAGHFRRHDLRKPLHLARTFDLVVSLEVAEHLPAECAGSFVESLTQLGSVVVFSAAIPDQGGTEHLNEQWPDYWRDLFAHRDFHLVDCLRHRFWNDERVAHYYAQNLLLYARADRLAQDERLQAEQAEMQKLPLRLVHPRTFCTAMERARWHLAQLQHATVAREAISKLTPADAAIVLIDDQNWDPLFVAPGRRVIPFLEHEGQWIGPPPNSETAIFELKRLGGSGVRYLVLAEPAFWWRQYYAAFYQHLLHHFERTTENQSAVIFDLGS